MPFFTDDDYYTGPALTEEMVKAAEAALEVFGEDVTRERLAAELPTLFPRVRIEVDGDVQA